MSEFSELLEKTGEYGVVYQVSHPIVFIDGLPKVRTHEVVVFETGEKAEVFAINRGKVEARVFSHDPVRVGTMATRTGKLLSIPVGPELLGHAINPLGEPLDESKPFPRPKEERDIDAKPVGISGRQKITKHLVTGVSLVDLMIPLGRGQRELIIGDRKTGKTSLIMTTIKNQIIEGNTVIYSAIAKKKSDISSSKSGIRGAKTRFLKFAKANFSAWPRPGFSPRAYCRAAILQIAPPEIANTTSSMAAKKKLYHTW